MGAGASVADGVAPEAAVTAQAITAQAEEQISRLLSTSYHALTPLTVKLDTILGDVGSQSIECRVDRSPTANPSETTATTGGQQDNDDDNSCSLLLPEDKLNQMMVSLKELASLVMTCGLTPALHKISSYQLFEVVGESRKRSRKGSGRAPTVSVAVAVSLAAHDIRWQELLLAGKSSRLAQDLAAADDKVDPHAVKQLESGMIVTKHPRHGKPEKRVLMLVGGVQFCLLKKVTDKVSAKTKGWNALDPAGVQVVKGIEGSEVFRKSTSKHGEVDANTCLYVQLRNRTIDLEFQDEEARDNVFAVASKLSAENTGGGGGGGGSGTGDGVEDGASGSSPAVRTLMMRAAARLVQADLFTEVSVSGEEEGDDMACCLTADFLVDQPAIAQRVSQTMSSKMSAALAAGELQAAGDSQREGSKADDATGAEAGGEVPPLPKVSPEEHQLDEHLAVLESSRLSAAQGALSPRPSASPRRGPSQRGSTGGGGGGSAGQRGISLSSTIDFPKLGDGSKIKVKVTKAPTQSLRSHVITSKQSSAAAAAAAAAAKEAAAEATGDEVEELNPGGAAVDE